MIEQEAGNDKRLEFFERDPIVWREHPQGELYRRLFALKRSNTALWNAKWGARMIDVPNSAGSAVFSFVRANQQDKVFAVFNFSPVEKQVTFREALCRDTYTDFQTGDQVVVDDGTTIGLQAWGYRILVAERTPGQ